MSQVKELIENLTENASRLRMANFLQNSVLPLVRKSMTWNSFEKELEACIVLEEVFKLYHQDSDQFHAAIIRQIQGMLGHRILTKMSKEDIRGEKALKVWNRSLQYFTGAKATFLS